MKKIIPLVLCTMLLSFCSEEKKLLRKASNAIDQSNFDKAVGYYDQIIHKNENSYFGHAGKGIVLSEFMGRHEAAIPHLEMALKSSPPEKSKPVVNGQLARSYHFIGNYKRALDYYGKLNNDPDFSDYDEFLTKRIADCKYAIEHPEVALPENQSLANLGTVVNTDKPEYTPVMVNNKMYFTSKRQDSDKEKKNGIDGKWFESVYVSEWNNGNWSTPAKVNLGETPGMGKKYGEAMTSASADGKSLFIYKGGKIFKTAIDDPSHKMEEQDKTVNFSSLQNHISLSPDGNTMFLTSESEKGKGGSDIYYSEKQGDGSWGEPKALDFAINTSYDEEAPYMNESGVLFFSSNGHPGYGGFDVYRTKKVNGAWTKPVNLGQPVNSPGDDIFFTLMPNSSKGYFASARPGGHGDLDIYKVHYILTEVGECKPAQEIMSINAMADPNDFLKYNVQLVVPEDRKSNIRSYSWSLNGKPLAQTKESFQHTFSQPDNYVITAKVVSSCDSCPTLQALCVEKTLEVKNTILASNEGMDGNNKATGKNKGKGKKGKGQKDGDDETGDLAANDSDKNKSGQGNKGENKSGKGDNANSGSASASGSLHSLTDQEMASLGWNSSPMLFELNQKEISVESKSTLDQNINILKEHNDMKVVITGHADARGSEGYNKSLSFQRASAVKQYFLQNGVKSSQIKSVKGKGEEELMNNCTDDSNCDESQHAQNRRVEIEVMGKGPGSITSK